MIYTSMPWSLFTDAARCLLSRHADHFHRRATRHLSSRRDDDVEISPLMSLLYFVFIILLMPPPPPMILRRCHADAAHAAVG